MYRISPTLRIAVGLASLGMSVHLAARSLGLAQDEWRVRMEGRAAVCELVALNAGRHLKDRNRALLQEELQQIMELNQDIKSIGIRHRDSLEIDVGDHAGRWTANSINQMYLPLKLNGKLVGRLELCFATETQTASGWFGFLTSRWIQQFLFLTSGTTLLFGFYLKKMLQHLDPATVVPERVRAALDTFAEGLLVLDGSENVVLANSAFKKSMNVDGKELQGVAASSMNWITDDEELPWSVALREGKPQLGKTMDLVVGHNRITYMVNASPIQSDKGKLQGILVSFDDVTLHEQRKRELENTLQVLGESRDQIRKQNQELKLLATRDPLTGCMNRRAFFDEIEHLWESMVVSTARLFCIMVDVDHFKAVNDIHGHSAGDIVLREIGKTLKGVEAAGVKVCRFGGEEFCLVIERRSLEEAREFAEDIRAVIKALRPAGLDITASLGVAGATIHDAFQSVLDHADQSLYMAKMSGRDRVVCFDDFTEEEFDLLMQQKSNPQRTSDEGPVMGIPFHAVSALLSALSYRDASTAEHSVRVADLCLRATDTSLTIAEQFVLETAALLHDVGKIGTPDLVLLKPGPLNDEEREIMSLHDFIGMEIVKTTFDNQELIDIISNRCAWYGGHPDRPEMPIGEDIPFGARILAICDAYDSLVTDLVYRTGSVPDDAISELRRCAGSQFDPQLVEQFISNLQSPTRAPLSLGSKEVSKSTAREIGLLMTKITEAYEANDLALVQHFADVLNTVATDTNLNLIAQVAEQLQDVSDDANLSEYTDVLSTLLDLCRITQRAYVGVSAESRQRREELTRRVFSEK